jgi:hypothetical protein
MFPGFNKRHRGAVFDEEGEILYFICQLRGCNWHQFGNSGYLGKHVRAYHNLSLTAYWQDGKREWEELERMRLKKQQKENHISFLEELKKRADDFLPEFVQALDNAQERRDNEIKEANKIAKGNRISLTLKLKKTLKYREYTFPQSGAPTAARGEEHGDCAMEATGFYGWSDGEILSEILNVIGDVLNANDAFEGIEIEKTN